MIIMIKVLHSAFIQFGHRVSSNLCLFQIKDYKSRVTEMEGQSRSSTGVSQLESKIQDLEERLRAEERYIFKKGPNELWF